jgi:hypothetical protein
MKMSRWNKARKSLCVIGAAGMLGQFGGCQIPDITIPTTLSGEEALITVVRGAILTPIDAWITQAVRNAFDEDDE